jgi:hypothetical protein
MPWACAFDGAMHDLLGDFVGFLLVFVTGSVDFELGTIG